ncbi:IS200/IS605 family element transposase accessory protein TnpB [Haloarcula rubripromontorii]|uniref:IS200/IS605 family element transposase accessory protein TnpB n=1 Tax=Haloarcula rubripromontorii TaxID=1705562 RepID=A0A847TY70_9EURY|nr:RNA-guided endonuclease TnpB family protein [Haloarcula rubripromontorii]NLV08243.1 IS200/IS605 family element transposase accessory protein TnpB [Haloarcula rubripromontorii]
MTATTTKTLEATLAPPTAHKERKLCGLLDTYREGLHEAFTAECDTMSATSDVVTPYDLPYQAKAALCNYVPQLHDTYNAQELDDDHPVRLTNQAAEFDHSAARDYEFTWWAPQPGRGTNFWIPLRINPAQEGLWHDLVHGDASAGQLRLQQHRTSWMLHVTVEFPVEEPDYEPTDDVTPVGFDIGESHLLAGCACEQETPTDPLLINGGRARHLRKEMFTTLKRLQERDAAEWRIDERFDHYQNALTDIIEKASRQAVEYACGFEKPVLVLEDLSYIREDLDYGEWMNRRLHAWAFARLQQRIEDKAREAGLPITYVRPEYTSQTCHECGHVGHRNGDEFRCQNDECWVTEYHADINAAVNIADRHDPWGESLPLKPAGDDISRDGSACDSATTHRETSEDPSQMTLSTFHGSEPSASNSET